MSEQRQRTLAAPPHPPSSSPHLQVAQQGVRVDARSLCLLALLLAFLAPLPALVARPSCQRGKADLALLHLSLPLVVLVGALLAGRDSQLRGESAAGREEMHVGGIIPSVHAMARAAAPARRCAPPPSLPPSPPLP